MATSSIINNDANLKIREAEIKLAVINLVLSFDPMIAENDKEEKFSQMNEQYDGTISLELFNEFKSSSISLLAMFKDSLEKNIDDTKQIIEAVAKVALSDNFPTDLQTLSHVVDDGNLASELELCNVYLSKRGRISGEYAKTVNDQSTFAESPYDMSKFRLRCLTGNSKVNVDVIRLQSKNRNKVVVDALFAGSEDKLNAFVKTSEPILSTFRRVYQYLSDKPSFNETSGFQPGMVMFMKEMSKLLGRIPENLCLGDSLPLEVPVEINPNLLSQLNDDESNSENNTVDDDEVEEITLKGKSDIIILKDVEHNKNSTMHDIDFLVELKLPKGKLYSKKCNSAKDQLICQLLGVWNKCPERQVVAGCLTDCFTIILVFSFQEDKKKFYVCESVVHSFDFLLNLCLLYINDKKVVKTMVKTAIKVPTDNIGSDRVLRSAVKSSAKLNSSNNNSNKRKTDASEAPKGDKRQKRKVVVVDMSYIDKEEEMERQADYLHRWYAKHMGHAYLCEDSLMGLGTRNVISSF